MKLNKWTVGLAAIGAVSAGSLVQAEEQHSVSTLVSGTSIGGYVDTSAIWAIEGKNAYSPAGARQVDGINLDVVKLNISKPVEAESWAAGYNVDLLFGPDANMFNTSTTGTATDFAIRQAYVDLQTPIGTGLNIRVGVFDTIVGYESHDSGANPNFTHSYGYALEPVSHTGVLLTYKLSDVIKVSGGMANTLGPKVNEREWNYDPSEGSHYSWLGQIVITAPESSGFLKGSTLYGGVVYGYDNGASVGTPATVTIPVGTPPVMTPTAYQGADRYHFYVGGTIATPITGLKAGLALDYSGIDAQSNTLQAGTTHKASSYAEAIAGYLTFAASEKLSLNGRVDYARADSDYGNSGLAGLNDIWAFTGTVDYKLWKNVITRGEVRYDYASPKVLGASGDKRDNWLLAANVIYMF